MMNSLVPSTRSLIALVLALQLAPAAHAAFPDGWAGYVTHSVTTEPSSDLTDFTFLISIDDFPSEFWTKVRTDGGDIRASKDPGGVHQLSVDVIEFSHVGTSGLIAVKWSGVKSSSVDEPLYIWAGNPNARMPAANDPYGQHQAYSPAVRIFWPGIGDIDRTAFRHSMTANGGVSLGGQPGPINSSKATQFDGSNDSISLPNTVFSELAHGTILVIARHERASSVGTEELFRQYYDDSDDLPMLAWTKVQSTGNLHAGWFESGDDDRVVEPLGTASWPQNAWSHNVLAWTKDGDTEAWVDGFSMGTAPDASPALMDRPMHIGSYSTFSGFYQGRIAMFTGYSIKLPLAWITYHKAMFASAAQTDFYGTWSWTPAGSPVNALALGFKRGDMGAAAANSALLDDSCAIRRQIIWPAGDFYFNKITGITSSTSAFDQLSWKGAASEYAWQHQEEGTQGDKQLTRFKLIGMNNIDDIWLDMKPRTSGIGATRIGPWRIEDITFQIPTGNKGSIFRIGDPADIDLVTYPATIRGLNVKGCYFTFEDLVAGRATGPSDDYVINPTETPPAVDTGWLINRPYGRNFAWHVTKGYDTSFEDIAVRGFYTNEFRQCDRLLIRNWRGGLCGRVIDVYGIPGQNAPVPAAIYGLWSEGHSIVGANLESCEVHGLNAESGYPDSYEPDIGDYDVNGSDPRRPPSSMDWTIATAGSSTLDFSDVPGGKPLSDYFEPRTVIRIDPTILGDQPRYLYIESVDDAGAKLHFRNATGSSYFPSAAGGHSDDIVRFFGTGANLVGDKTAVFGHNVHVNVAVDDFPMGFIVPGAIPTLVSGGVHGLTLNSLDPSTRWRVVADCGGTQHSISGGVRWIGPEAPDHPMVVKDGDPYFDYDPNYRFVAKPGVRVPRDSNHDGTIDGVSTLYRAYPGRGVRYISDDARNLRYRRQPDPEAGGDVWVHRLNDSVNGWVLSGLSKSGRPIDYAIRVYADGTPDNTADLRVYGGEGSQTPHDNLTDGWQTVTGRLNASQVDADGEVILSIVIDPQADDIIEVAWIELMQEE